MPDGDGGTSATFTCMCCSEVSRLDMTLVLFSISELTLLRRSSRELLHFSKFIAVDEDYINQLYLLASLMLGHKVI